MLIFEHMVKPLVRTGWGLDENNLTEHDLPVIQRSAFKTRPHPASIVTVTKWGTINP